MTSRAALVIFLKKIVCYQAASRKQCLVKQIKLKSMLLKADAPAAGKLTIASSPIRLVETPGDVNAHAPLRRSHSADV